MLVRGDRTVQNIGTSANPTIMRSTGALFEPSNLPPTSTVASGLGIFTSVGNPYASPIDLDLLSSTGFSSVSGDVYVWDQLLAGSFSLGDFQLLEGSNGFRPVPGGTHFYPTGVPHPVIQSGQAFFVSTAASGTGLVTFTEGVKSTRDMLVNKSANLMSPTMFTANLYTDQGIIAGGNAVKFDNRYTNKLDAKDVVKFPGAGETFTIVRENKSLTLEARANVCETDSIFYNFSNLRKQKYQLRFHAQNMSESGLNAYLLDRYLRTTTLLSVNDSSFVDFVVNEEHASNKSRFIVVFKKGAEGLIKNSEIKDNSLSLIVSPNPIENKVITFQFSNNAGRYGVQVFNRGGQLMHNGTLKITDKNVNQTIKLGNQISSGNYQLVIVAPDGNKWSRQVMIK